MGQALFNLLDNAIHFTPHSGRVTIDATVHSEEIELSILDTGEGITPDDLPFIFERFYRTGKSEIRLTDGYGMGLSIVRSVIQAHGGSIAADSAGRGKGSPLITDFAASGRDL